MARPAKFKDPQKLNLYVEKTTVRRGKRIAKRLGKSLSDLFTEFIEKHPDGK